MIIWKVYRITCYQKFVVQYSCIACIVRIITLKLIYVKQILSSKLHAANFRGVNIPVFIPPVEVVFLQVRGEVHFGIHRRGEVLPGFYDDFDFPRSPAGGAPHIAAVKVQGDHLEILFRELGGYFQNRAYVGLV